MTAPRDHPIRALVIGADPRVHRALAGLLLAGGHVELVDDADARCEGDGVASGRCPDVALIDLDRADEQAWLREIALLRARCPAVAIVAVAAASDVESSAHAAGVDVFVSKLVTAEGVCDAVDRAVHFEGGSNR